MIIKFSVGKFGDNLIWDDMLRRIGEQVSRSYPINIIRPIVAEIIENVDYPYPSPLYDEVA